MIIQCASAVINGALVNEHWIEITQGVISEIQSGNHDAPDKVIKGTLIPAFVDIHCHGGGGSYFSDLSGIEDAIDFHKSHGTGTLIASLVSEPLHVLRDQIARLVPLYHSGEIAGIHLEGPYLSHARCGAHLPENLATPVWEDIDELLAIGEGAIVMITIAPELPGAIECIEKMVDSGVVAAIGHTAASLEVIEEAVEAGADLITHFTNGMVKPEQDRELTDSLLDDNRLSIELILDGHHVSHENTSEALSIDPSRVIAITDAMQAAGQDDGQYLIGSIPVVVKDGVARLENGALAGSTLTMDRAFARLVNEYGVSIEDAVLMTAENASLLLGLENSGVITVGAPADLLEWDGTTVSVVTKSY